MFLSFLTGTWKGFCILCVIPFLRSSLWSPFITPITAIIFVPFSMYQTFPLHIRQVFIVYSNRASPFRESLAHIPQPHEHHSLICDMGNLACPLPRLSPQYGFIPFRACVPHFFRNNCCIAFHRNTYGASTVKPMLRGAGRILPHLCVGSLINLSMVRCAELYTRACSDPKRRAGRGGERRGWRGGEGGKGGKTVPKRSFGSVRFGSAR